MNPNEAHGIIVVLSIAQCAAHTQPTPCARTKKDTKSRPIPTTTKSVRSPASPVEADLSDAALVGGVVVRRELRPVPVGVVRAEGVLHGGLRHSPDARQAVHHLLLLPVPLHRNRQLRRGVVGGGTAVRESVARMKWRRHGRMGYRLHFCTTAELADGEASLSIRGCTSTIYRQQSVRIVLCPCS